MNKILYFGAALVCLLLSSCNDYLNIAPKGNKIPTTLEDFEALLRDQYTIGRTPVTNALYLLNDIYLTNSQVNTPSLSRANYMWDESADRIVLNNSDEGTYYVLYGAISSCNLIVENVPTATEATDAERNVCWSIIMPIRMMRQRLPRSAVYPLLPVPILMRLIHRFPFRLCMISLSKM